MVFVTKEDIACVFIPSFRISDGREMEAFPAPGVELIEPWLIKAWLVEAWLVEAWLVEVGLVEA